MFFICIGVNLHKCVSFLRFSLYIHVHTHTCNSFHSFCNLYQQTLNTYKYILWSNMSNMGHLSWKDFKLEIPAICVFIFYLVDRGIITVHASVNINLFIPLTSPPPNSIIIKKKNRGNLINKMKTKSSYNLHKVKHNLQKKEIPTAFFFSGFFFQKFNSFLIKHLSFLP